MRSRGHLRPKIDGVTGTHRLTRKSGQIEWVTGLFLVLFLAVLLSAQLQLDAYRAASLYLEDALAASNLASAVINLEEYGISHRIEIDDPVKAYERYLAALKLNLQLDENWEGSNKALISGKVEVTDYIVYNVDENIVTVYQVRANRQVEEWQGTLGSVKAPDGTVIESTGVYSRIKFPIEGFLGVTVEAEKGKLADIVASAE